MDLLARWAAVAMVLGGTTAIALFNIASGLMLLGWLMAGGYAARWRAVRDNPITLPTLLLAALVLAGSLYGEAAANVVGRHLYVYSRLPLMLVALSLFVDASWRKRAIQAFVLGALITLGSTYASLVVHVPWADTYATGTDGRSQHVFSDYIAQGVIMAFFTAYCVVRAKAAGAKHWRLLWALAAVLSAISITHLLMGRTGVVVLLAVLSVLAFASLRGGWRIGLVLAVLVAAPLALLSSESMQQRLQQGRADFERFVSSGVADSSSSVGARLDMWRNSLRMIGDSPFWGQGTGSYRTQSERLLRDHPDPNYCRVICIHPHNQFLFFGVEYGWFGLLAYAFFLWRPAMAAQRAEGEVRLATLAFLTVLFVDSFINSPLWITSERNFYTVLLPAVAAGLPGWRPWRLRVRKGAAA